MDYTTTQSWLLSGNTTPVLGVAIFLQIYSWLKNSLQSYFLIKLLAKEGECLLFKPVFLGSCLTTTTPGGWTPPRGWRWSSSSGTRRPSVRRWKCQMKYKQKYFQLNLFKSFHWFVNLFVKILPPPLLVQVEGLVVPFLHLTELRVASRCQQGVRGDRNN